ncbi:hypothetical protein TCA2_4424 [Paenibacillus sp. TCA20]|uniref:hypothetical protein n=1 Tax=Paenibacillus sp. TCA20 TaxID=1499968 RepID=UPI0004D5EABD|nr:hypothetical protein [Paenibacillus sp. TCA20]GAK41932.1 hypothetical protein TCA2_4424 [Paenibacillus sp. TCA20]
MYDKVNCPYCGGKNDVRDALSDGWLSSDNTTEWCCQHCEEEFMLHVEFHPSFTATKIIHSECDACKFVTSDIRTKDNIYPFPEALLELGEKFCHSCWLKYMSKEMDLKYGANKNST